jgi:hypothetical protein
MLSQRSKRRLRRLRSRLPCIWLAVLVTITGCHGYSDASPRTYEYAKALYSICNRQADDKLTEVGAMIDADIASGQLSTREAGWLTAIIDDAARGDWQAAMKEARKLMEDQTQRKA